MERRVEFAELDRLAEEAEVYKRFASDYVCMRLGPQTCSRVMQHVPARLVAMALCMVRRGCASVVINAHKYNLDKWSLVNIHANMVVESVAEFSNDMDVMMIVLSPQFLRDINIDLNAVNFQSMVKSHASPVLSLSVEEKNVMKEYFDILEYNASRQTENVFSKNIARSLVQSVFYQLLHFNSVRNVALPASEDDGLQIRKMTYLREFMQLVQVHHFKERSLSFYADRLCITPKYLSRVIKEATGRSAADWIDQFVILEAKNLLRFSSKNVQQVAYELNFSNQSSFGKFFKHLTGMSPSEYQKT